MPRVRDFVGYRRPAPGRRRLRWRRTRRVWSCGVLPGHECAWACSFGAQPRDERMLTRDRLPLEGQAATLSDLVVGRRTDLHRLAVGGERRHDAEGAYGARRDVGRELAKA